MPYWPSCEFASTLRQQWSALDGTQPYVLVSACANLPLGPCLRLSLLGAAEPDQFNTP